MRWMGLLLSMFVALGLACNLGGSGGESPPGATPAGEEEQGPPAGRGGAVTSLDDIQRALVQIEAQGTFIDPEFGLQVNAAGRGSGFIIDPSGIAVTNNHVVTGAALLKVWVGGESEPRNARILGVSECSDLAVIDIEGGDYPYLDWHPGDINVGLEVYAAGFPLGDPEFTLTKGIVSKAQADGESDWASVDSVLEHDATINPGNSGGPLVDAQGRVVGINYAGSSQTSQYFAIARDEALEIIDTLRQGTDVDSVGINGLAVMSQDGSLTGVWVSSVASGSAADEAGIKPGDIVTTMEGLVLATDGTMADYCDILRTQGSDATLSVEILRYAANEYLTGQLNGRPLEVGGVLGQELAGQVEDTGDAYSDYVQVTDNYGAIVVEVPASWSDVDGSPWVDAGETIGASIWAAPDLDGFINTWGVPGVKFDVSDDLAKLGGYIQVLDFYRSNTYVTDCELDGRYDYNDGYYRGKYDYFIKCGGSGGPDYLILSAVPVDSSVQLIIVVQVQILTAADLDATDRILATFDVVGQLP
jgi:serine protease Do